ncbi:MAG: aryl-sulfate sulfotransferase [Solirubrobacterales bacterium]|nr:aryl-sulfate sulfotransferase [Solirubrobacterales bacterium]MCB0860841.1 aryl-sulfate sulfotransferase [Solirubrobacterales bacterium]
MALSTAAFADGAAARKNTMVSVYPAPGTPVVSPKTTFSFRYLKPGTLGPVKIFGSSSGRVAIKRRIVHSDRDGISIVPGRSFVPGETVSVYTRKNVRRANRGDFKVRVGEFYDTEQQIRDPLTPVTNGLKSRPDLKIPEIEVNSTSDKLAPGKYLVGLREGALAIFDGHGRISWLRRAVDGLSNAEFHTLRGRPVLTFFNQPTATKGSSYNILNQKYNRIYQVTAKNGYRTDLHEFQITPRNTALVLAYQTLKWNLSRFGGAENAALTDNIIQEIDLKTGAVMFEWHTLGNIGLNAASERPPSDGSAWDPAHINSIAWDGNSLLISARYTSSIYRVGRASARIRWILRGDGGKPNSFRMDPKIRFVGQHDVRRLSNGKISLFDNAEEFEGSSRSSRSSSATVISLSGKTKASRRAKLAGRYRHPGGSPSRATGGVEVEKNRNVVVSWGNLSGMTEFSPSGEVLFDAKLPSPSYRARKSQWHGIPRGRPAIASRDNGDGTVTVFASWNGSQDIARWVIMTGDGSDSPHQIGGSVWKNLETAVKVSGAETRVMAVAYDNKGERLGQSALAPIGKQVR